MYCCYVFSCLLCRKTAWLQFSSLDLHFLWIWHSAQEPTSSLGGECATNVMHLNYNISCLTCGEMVQGVANYKVQWLEQEQYCYGSACNPECIGHRDLSLVTDKPRFSRNWSTGVLSHKTETLPIPHVSTLDS